MNKTERKDKFVGNEEEVEAIIRAIQSKSENKKQENDKDIRSEDRKSN